MTNLTRIFAALGLATTMGTAALAQTSIGSENDVDIIGMTCADFLNADAAMQMDFTRALGVMNSGEVELDPNTAADVDTIDNDVRAVAAACEGNEAMNLVDLSM